MQKTSKIISLSVASLVLAFTLVTGPVFADHGSDSGGSGSGSTTTSTSGGSGDSSQTTTSDSTTTQSGSGSGSGDSSGSGTSGSDSESKTSGDQNSTETEQADSQTETELHQKGKDLVGQLENEHKGGKSAEQKQQSCQSHKQGLTQKFSSISKNADAFQSRINDIFAKAQAYQQASNLTVTNWSSLVSAATSAQATSAASIAALKGVTPTLDCNNTNVASDVATFKVAAQTTRDNLKAYKTAVHALLQALENAKDANATGSTNQ